MAFLQLVFCLLLMTISLTVAKIADKTEDSADPGFLEKVKQPSSARGKEPGESCTGPIDGSDCDFSSLLLCMDNVCTCPELDHDEVVKLVERFFPVPPTVTSRFSLNTTWREDWKQCVGMMGSLCITNVPPEIPLPIKVHCNSSLSCQPYPDRDLQGIIGACGSSASALSITITSFVAALTVLAYCFSN